MKRRAITETLLGSESLPLWVPLLTHYRTGAGRAVVDVDRMTRHLRAVGPHVSSWMFAGSTGDGWDIDASQFESLLAFAAGLHRGQPESRVLVGVLRPTTDDVVEWIDRVHSAIGTSRSASVAENVARLAEKRWVGITVCPPVGDEVSQDAIVEHYRTVASAARMPLAVYQLPQVTQCTIEPATMKQLVGEHDEIILFKDSSGQDAIARAGVDLDGVVLVRGAEGEYAEMLRPLGGPYDGLLLSTANNFGRALRSILDHIRAGRGEAASRESAVLSSRVRELFAAGADAPVGNAFANVNRAVDHLFAHGAGWADAALPTLFDGSRLPESVVGRIADVLGGAEVASVGGYLSSARS